MPIFDEDLSPEDWALIEKYDVQEYDREQERRHRFEEYEPNECQDDQPCCDCGGSGIGSGLRCPCHGVASTACPSCRGTGRIG